MDDDTTAATEPGDTTGIPGAVDPAHPLANGACSPKARPTSPVRKAQASRLANVPPIEPGAVPRRLSPSLQIDLRREIDVTLSTALGSAAETIGEFAKSIVSIDDAAALIRADKDLTPEAKRRRIAEKIELFAPRGWFAAEQTIEALSEVLERTGGRWRQTIAAKTDTIRGALLEQEVRTYLRSLPLSERYAAISAALRSGDHDTARAGLLVPHFLVGLDPAQRAALEAQAGEQVDQEAAALHKARPWLCGGSGRPQQPPRPSWRRRGLAQGAAMVAARLRALARRSQAGKLSHGAVDEGSPGRADAPRRAVDRAGRAAVLGPPDTGASRPTLPRWPAAYIGVNIGGPTGATRTAALRPRRPRPARW